MEKLKICKSNVNVNFNGDLESLKLRFLSYELQVRKLVAKTSPIKLRV